LDIQKRALRADHPVLLSTLTALGDALMVQNRIADAKPLLEEAVRIGRLRLPAAHSQRRRAETLLASLR
jgi:hypothetical protein